MEESIKILKQMKAIQFGYDYADCGTCYDVLMDAIIDKFNSTLLNQNGKMMTNREAALLMTSTEDLTAELKERGLGVFPLAYPFTYLPNHERKPTEKESKELLGKEDLQGLRGNPSQRHSSSGDEG